MSDLTVLLAAYGLVFILRHKLFGHLIVPPEVVVTGVTPSGIQFKEERKVSFNPVFFLDFLGVALQCVFCLGFQVSLVLGYVHFGTFYQAFLFALAGASFCYVLECGVDWLLVEIET